MWSTQNILAPKGACHLGMKLSGMILLPIIIRLGLVQDPLGIFCPINSLFINRNWWLILLSENLIVFWFMSKINWTIVEFKGFQIYDHFLSFFSICWVVSYFVIFHWLKLGKHTWDSFFHLVTETGSWFVLPPPPPP